jgi:hypothetical protein
METYNSEILEIFKALKNLRVIYLKGNSFVRGIPNYRKTLIKSIPNITYLDDRPVDEGDRLAAEAFFEGGLEAERKARADYKKKKDIRFNVREAEKEYFKESFEERRKKALESLEREYETRKLYLEEKKKKLLNEFDEFPEKKKELKQELSSIDFQIEENDKLKIKEETDYVFSMSKRAKMDKYSTFEYEEWMDSVLENHVVENLFDFPRCVKLIQLDFKNKNVKNWELFNELDLRTKWTEIELKKFRKDETNNYDFIIEEGKIYNEIVTENTDSKKILIEEGSIDEEEYETIPNSSKVCLDSNQEILSKSNEENANLEKSINVNHIEQELRTYKQEINNNFNCLD